MSTTVYTPVQGARWMAKQGLHITPLHGKIPFVKDWQKSATTDLEQISKIAQDIAGVNFGCVAKRGEFFIVDEDIPGFVERFTKGTGIVLDGLRVRSSGDRFHYYFKASPESDELFGKNIPESLLGGAASVRWNDQQCVCPFSIHPEKKTPYLPVDVKAEIKPAPIEFIKWILAQQTKPQTAQTASTCDDAPIPFGQHDSTLFAIAAKLRAAGAEYDEILSVLRREVERCEGRGADADEMCINKAKSVCKYPKGTPVTILIGGKLPGAAPEPPAQPELVIDTSEACSRPVFPYRVMEGTTLYEELVKPVVANSSKHAEFVFIPAVQMMLNYLSGKVRIAMQDTNLNLYVGLVSPPGEFFKSSSCKLSHDYFKLMGLSTKYGPNMPGADGRVVVAQIGSSEGFGLAMSGINGKHAILFNDELGKLVAKAGIENSALPHDLLSWYESNDFGNTVKSKKDSFSFEAGTYTFGWQWCTTTRGFNRHWPKIAGAVSGMEDRMFFVVSPEKPKPAGAYHLPQLDEAAKVTHAAIEAAMLKGVYEFAVWDDVAAIANGMNPRTMQMLFALALYFAVDLKRDKIDLDCLTRAKELVAFRDQSTAFLSPIEADNEQGRLQQEITRELRQNKGKMKNRDLCKELNAQRCGTERWNAAYWGLVKEGIIAEFKEKSKSGQTCRITALLILND